MKRFTIISALVLLLSAMVLCADSCHSDNNPGGNTGGSTGSGGSGTGSDIANCLGSIALQVVATLADQEELTFGKLISSAGVCIDAAIAFFSSPSNPTPSSPEVDINASSSDGSFTSSVQSNTLGNCSDSTETLQFNFYVPFEMVVGPQGSSQADFTASPNGTDDNSLVAQQVFSQFNSEINSTTTNGPSQSEVYNIGPHTQVTFTLPIQVYYQSGEARIVHTDGSTVSLPWYFIDGYQQTGPITYTTTSC
ncbi:MAG TPA: hypothetical protein VJ761_20565 [Ktedonobacteraceae bacterium]|nr:hypothetical protein [Ktedonobacteraceae bacterium]